MPKEGERRLLPAHGIARDPGLGRDRRPGHRVGKVVSGPGLVVPVLQPDLAEQDSEYGRDGQVRLQSARRPHRVGRKYANRTGKRVAAESQQ